MKKFLIITILMGCMVFPLYAQLICFEFPPDTFERPGVPTVITAADLNGDNFDDLAVGLYNEDFISIMLNDGEGNFENFTTCDIYPMLVQQIVAVKINNDEFIDLVIVGAYRWFFIYMGNGDGTFYLSSVPFMNCFTSDAVAGFFNSDNYIDLALIHNDNSTLSIMFGEYTGTFHEAHNYWTFGDEPRRLYQGDFNEDGNVDLVVCNYGDSDGIGSSLVMFSGTGLGTFETHVLSEENYPQSAAVGDFNMDSHQDIIFKRYDRWFYKLWGNGDGTFQEPVVEDISAIYYAVYLHVTDIDSDSVPDLAMGGHYFNMHINDGLGNFSDTLFINEKSNPRRVGDITTGNFNGDSKPDIVSTHIEGPDSDYGSIAVYLNCLHVGVPEQKPVDDKIYIYPNPASDGIHILFRENKLNSYFERGMEIFNVFGEKVSAINIPSNTETYDVNVSNLSSGLYLLIIRERQKVVYQGKFLIAR